MTNTLRMPYQYSSRVRIGPGKARAFVSIPIEKDAPFILTGFGVQGCPIALITMAADNVIFAAELKANLVDHSGSITPVLFEVRATMTITIEVMIPKAAQVAWWKFWKFVQLDFYFTGSKEFQA